jgi:hypothetical protein
MKNLFRILTLALVAVLASCTQDPTTYKQVVKNNTDQTITFTAVSETCHNTYTLKPGEEVTTHDARVMNAPSDCQDHKYTLSTVLDDSYTDIANQSNWDFAKGDKTVTCTFTFEKR